MYARRLRCRSHTWSSLFRNSGHLSRPSRRDITSDVSAIRKFRKPLARFQPTYFSSRFFSAEGDGRNASEGKHVPVNVFDKGKPREEAVVYSDHCTEHARLGELDQQEWLRNEKLSMENRRRAPPFLTRRQKFKKEFLRRVVPWEKITVSWDKFPYYIDENARNLLVECAAAHLKHKDCAAKYGARLSSSGPRILLRTIPGTELYRERSVKALARELQVPLLVLDSSVLAPYDYGEDCSESESEDDNPESGAECTSELEGGDGNNTGTEEWSSSNEKSGESEEDDTDDKESQKVIKNCNEVLEGFARVGNFEL